MKEGPPGEIKKETTQKHWKPFIIVMAQSLYHNLCLLNRTVIDKYMSYLFCMSYEKLWKRQNLMVFMLA